MPSLITHIFIPLAILLIFSEKLGISKRLILILSFFSIIPDLDMFLQHRMIFHNIFFIILIPAIIYLIRKDINVCCISLYYIFSHVFLDTFNSGTYILYPVYDKVLNIMIGFSYKTSLVFVHQIELLDTMSNKGMSMAMVSSLDIATLILISIVVVAIMIKNKHKSLYTTKSN